ncbi:MAG: glycosyltransferase [Rhodanobacter sp.]
MSQHVARKARECPRLVCAANLVEVKGHRYLIDALNLLRANGLNATLDLCGDGPELHALVAQCDALGLNDIVSFKGRVPHQQLLDALGNGEYDLFVLPSIQISASVHEGIPVSLLEAMGYGVPVVSTNTGSIGELLPASLGLTVPDRNPSALAAAIREVLCDSSRYADLSKALQRMVMDDWQISPMVDKLEKLIVGV